MAIQPSSDLGPGGSIPFPTSAHTARGSAPIAWIDPSGHLGRFGLSSAWVLVCWLLMAGTAVVGLILVLLPRTIAGHEGGFAASWHTTLALVVWSLLVPIGPLAWSIAQAQKRVWVRRVAPRGRVRQAERRLRRTLAGSMALAILPLVGVLLLAPPPAPQATAHGFRLLVLPGAILALGVLAAAACQGQVGGAWLLPALRRWRDRVRLRVHFLGAAPYALCGIATMQMTTQVWSGHSEGLFFMPWGSAWTPLDAYRILLFAGFALPMAACPALHWRRLLAPGGTTRAQVGTQVAVWTFLLLGRFLLLALGLVALIAWPFQDDPGNVLSRVPGLALQYGPVLLLELALGTLLGVGLRGVCGTELRAMLGLAAIGAAVGVAHLALYGMTGAAMPELMRREGEYLAGGLLLGLVLAVWNQRAWRTVDLAGLMRSHSDAATGSASLRFWR